MNHHLLQLQVEKSPLYILKMRFEICACLFVLVAISSISAVEPDNRFLINSGSISFTTFTILKVTTTTTSTYTSTTTCTTSSDILTTCTIGRRRRGLFYDEAASQGRNRRGLFYNDEEVANNDGSAFLPSEKYVFNLFYYFDDEYKYDFFL
jgi:hypothetical protein